MLVSSRSSTTTSGLCCSTSLTTSVPSVVQAATLMSGSPSSSARRPSMTMAWSSASSTRIMTRASFRRQRDGQGRPPAGRALERERAAEHFHAVLDAAQPEVPSLHAHVLFARQHALRLEAAAVVRDGQRDRQTPSLDAHALPRGPGMPVAVRERFLQDPVDRDLRGEGAVAQLPGELELHRLLRQRLMLHGEALDDLAQLAPLEARGAEGADEVANLAEGTLEQPHGLAGALGGGGVRRERALEHLQLGQRGEDVLDRAVVHVEHDALQLALTGREQAPRRGARLGVSNFGHTRPRGNARSIRSAANPSVAPIASAMATRTPPSMLTARSPIATPAAPRTSACTRSWFPSARATPCARMAQTTPEIVAATVFWRPGTPPPAASEHPRATITGHNDRFRSEERRVG